MLSRDRSLRAAHETARVHRPFWGCSGYASSRRARAAVDDLAHRYRDNPIPAIYAAFEQRLRELGYVEGQNLVLDYLNPEMQAEGVAGAIKELLRRKVDIIVAPYESGVKAALAASDTVPVVMIATEYDPLALGYVNSLARPGGHVTGVFLQQIELASKRLQLLKDALPSFQSAIMFWDALSEYQWKATNSAAAPFGLRLAGVELVKQPYDYEGAWASVPPDSRNTLILPIAPVFYRERERLADFAIRHGIASMFAVREFATAGGLMSYGPDFPAMFRRVAEYVDRIAKGAKAADLPLNSLPSSSWSSIAKPQRPSTSIFQTSCSRSPTR